MCCLHGAFVTVMFVWHLSVRGCAEGVCGQEMCRAGHWAGMCSAGFCAGCEPVLPDMVPQRPRYQQLESGSSLGSRCGVQCSWKAEWAACLTQLAVSEPLRLMGSRRFFLSVLVKNKGEDCEFWHAKLYVLMVLILPGISVQVPVWMMQIFGIFDSTLQLIPTALLVLHSPLCRAQRAFIRSLLLQCHCVMGRQLLRGFPLK